ncbi:MAG TPA: fibronectin type III domain-containing protein, partial [Planctomycetota bacterium]|nr:fibronectin type III domain-containing protein [Planctomycetota bacterium]
ATSYVVSRGTQSGGPYSQIGTTSSTSFQDTGLTANTTYYYVAQAMNAGGTSANSSQASATTLPNAPSPPANLTATTVSQTEINLTWTASSGATSYVVSRGAQSGGPYTQIGTTSSTTFQDSSLTANTTYYYVVQAVNAGGTSANSNQASATTLPNGLSPPTNVSATTVSQTQINVTWIASPQATSYTVSRGTQSGGPYTQVGTTAATSFQDTGLTANTTYYYVVQAVNAVTTSANSSEASATTLPNAPSPPTNVSATTVSQTQINVTWTASPGATSYAVSRGTQSGGPYSQVGTTSTTSFQDMGLTANTTYYYVVQATNAGGTSASSNQASATTLPNAPSPPTNVSATTVSQTQINLTWTASSGATTYAVARGTQSGGPYSQIGTTSTTSFQDTGLTANTTYVYVVQATNAGGTSASSNQASATTLPNAPSPPTNVAATAISQSQIQLMWTASSGATSYVVSRGTQSGGPYSQIGTASTTSFQDTGLTAHTTYDYVVQAVNAGGTSAKSSEASATTLSTANTATAFALSISPGSASDLVAGSTNDLTISAVGPQGTQATFVGNALVTTSDGLEPLNGLVVPFTAADQGTVVLQRVAIFTRAGAVTVTVTSLSVPTIVGSLAVNAVPGPATSFAFISGGQNQTTTTGATPAPVAVAITDFFGNGIVGQPIQAAGAGQTVTQNADSLGRAILAFAPINATGTYPVQITAPGLGLAPLGFTIAVQAPAPPTQPPAPVIATSSGTSDEMIFQGQRPAPLSLTLTSGVGGAPSVGVVVEWDVLDSLNNLVAVRKGITDVNGLTTIIGPRLFANDTYTSNVTVLGPQPSTTTFQVVVQPQAFLWGFVLDASQTPSPPVPGVFVSTSGISATTESDGSFLVTPATPGSAVVDVNGAAIGSAHISVSATVAATGTLLPQPIFLPKLDPSQSVPVTLAASGITQTSVTVASSSVPGASLTVPAGTTVGFPSGAPATLTPVPVQLSELPWPLPAGAATGTAMDVEPAGTTFSSGATLSMPNDFGLAPGSTLNVYGTSLASGAFQLIGQAQVSADGSTVVSVGAIVTELGCFVVSPLSPPAPTNVTGMIVDAHNNPITGASVGTEGLSSVTDTTGSFSISGVAVASSVSVTATTIDSNGFPETGVSQTVAPVANGTTNLGTFTIAAQTKVQGRVVVQQSGSPVPVAGATVSVLGYLTTTAGDGTFSLPGVPSAGAPVKVFAYTVPTPTAPGAVQKSFAVAPSLPPSGRTSVGDITIAPVGGPFQSFQVPSLMLGATDLTATSTYQSDRGGQVTTVGANAATRCPVCGRLYAATQDRVLVWNTLPASAFAPADLVLGPSSFSAPYRATRSPACPQQPSAVFTDHTRLYVAEGALNRVLIWNDTASLTNGQPADLVLGQPDFNSTQPNRGGSPSEATLSFPTAIYSDGQSLFVADGGNNRVLRWSLIPATNGTPADLVIGQPDFASSG